METESLFVDKAGNKILPKSHLSKSNANCLNLVHYRLRPKKSSFTSHYMAAENKVFYPEEKLKASDNLQKTSIVKRMGNSLFIFGPKNCLRKLCWKISRSKVFDYFMYLTIIVSLVPMINYSPLNDPESEL